MNLHTATSNGIDHHDFVIFDGHLTNRSQLQEQLGLKDDISIEDILHTAFMTWQMDFLNRLEGSFALAVFDLEGNRLILARDRFGTIPLYVATQKEIAFASSTDAFLQQNKISKTASIQAIWDYLTLGAIPQPNTIIAGVQSIRPGEAVSINLNDGKLTRKFWWSLQAEAAAMPKVLQFEEAADNVRKLLDESISTLAPSLGKTCLLLSGGIDSTILLHALKAQAIPFEALTIGYEQKHGHSEATQAENTARAAGIKHTVVTVTDWDVAKTFTKFIKAMDQPSRDGFNSFQAAMAARHLHADTVISGVGGDELFAGYAYVKRHLTAERLAPYLTPLKPILRQLPDRYRHNLMLPCLTRAERLETIRAQLYQQGKLAIVNPQFIEGLTPTPWLNQCQKMTDPTLDCLQQLSLFDLTCDMEHTLLRDAFLQASAQQLRLVTPMLDHQLAALAWNLPPEAKIRQGVAKAVLLHAYRDLTPHTLAQVPKKGFELPLLKWLGSCLLTRAQDAFNSPQAKLIFNRQFCLNWTARLTDLQPRDYPLWSRFTLLEYLISRQITHFA